MRANLASRHGGFTLVELLVVISIIIVLTTIAVLVFTGPVFGDLRTTSEADKVSQMLLIARQTARRDGAATGVRFTVEGGTTVRTLTYIQVPPPYFPIADPPATDPTNTPSNRIRATVVKSGGTPADFVQVDGPASAMTDLSSVVVAGDVLHLPEFNTLHRVDSVTGSGSVRKINFPPTTAKLPDIGGPGTASTPQSYTTTSFGFYLAARPQLGQEPVQLGDKAIIDVSTDAARPTSSIPAGAASFDVLFAPSGAVVGTGLGQVVLWVRDPAYPHPRVNTPALASDDKRAGYDNAGPMVLIGVTTRTGFVGTYPVAKPDAATGTFPPGKDPFEFARDGKSNGL